MSAETLGDRPAAIDLNPDFLRDMTRAGVTALLGDAQPEIVDLVVLAIISLGLVVFAVALDVLEPFVHGETAEARPVRRSVTIVALGALAWWCLSWMHQHPSGDIMAFAHRCDQMLFAGLTGLLLAAWPRTRSWVLALVSLRFLSHSKGIYALVALGPGLLGVALTRVPMLRTRTATALSQGAVIALALACVLGLRMKHHVAGPAIWAVYCWMVLRHVSFVVETRGGRTGSLGDYLCYQLFYPAAIGASQVYNEFADWNLRTRPIFQRRVAVSRIIGGLWLWAAASWIKVGPDALLVPTGTAALWGQALWMFCFGAVFGLGSWQVAEGVALLFGVRLRPNFAGVLTATNPSAFWRAWRGTMTHWLIRYVYVPLGGRERRSRNIALVFAVSATWHWIGMATTTRGLGLLAFLPIGTWAAANAVGVIGHAITRDRRFLPAAVPRPIRISLAWMAAMAFGSLTTTLLSYPLDHLAEFLPFLLRLSGLAALVPS